MSNRAATSLLIGFVVIAIIVALIVGPGEEQGTSRGTSPAPTPVPTLVLVQAPSPDQAPPQPHSSGEPRGLGATRSDIISAFEPAGFVFQPSSIDGRPSAEGFSSIGPYARLHAIGTERAVTWISFEVRWEDDTEAPLDYLLTLVRLTTPKWSGAADWAHENALAIRRNGGGAFVAHGNYAITLNLHPPIDSVIDDPRLSKAPLLTANIRALYASCADAIAAQEFTFQEPGGSSRGYPSWKVPFEPNEDGDSIVCEEGVSLS